MHSSPPSFTAEPADSTARRRSLADGNRFQRAYHRWALPHYERIGRDDPSLRAEIEEIDQWLYSRKSLPAWLGWLLGLAAVVGGLYRAGVSLGEALVLGTLIYGGLSFVLLAAWLSPKDRKAVRQRSERTTLTRFVWGLVAGMAAALAGLVVGHWIGKGAVDWAGLHQLMEKAALTVLLVAGGMALLVGIVAWAGRTFRARRLQRLSLMAERDAARAAAAEAELRLLQAQIQPHFVFNTLATLQHWVDRSDPRAAPLLRELTGFLRRSTEMLGRHQVPLSEEAQAARHYLAILQARLGDRLAFEVAIDPACEVIPLPPGLLLTLVENAVEHGIEPSLRGGRIEVTACRDTAGWTLQVDDTGQGLAAPVREGVGLSNLRQRLAQHYGGHAVLTLEPHSMGGTRAAIRCAEAA